MAVSVEQGMEKLSAGQRYANLWAAVNEANGCPLTAEVVEPYVPGSLRYERTKISAVLGEVEVGVTNGQATFGGQDPAILRRLAFLEEALELAA